MREIPQECPFKDVCQVFREGEIFTKWSEDEVVDYLLVNFPRIRQGELNVPSCYVTNKNGCYYLRGMESLLHLTKMIRFIKETFREVD